MSSVLSLSIFCDLLVTYSTFFSIAGLWTEHICTSMDEWINKTLFRLYKEEHSYFYNSVYGTTEYCTKQSKAATDRTSPCSVFLI